MLAQILKTPLNRRTQAFVLVAGVVLAQLAFLFPVPKAYALSDFAPKCAGTLLEEWDWPAKMRAVYSTSPAKNGGNIPTFNPDSDSYIILRTTATGPDRNVFEMFHGPSLSVSYENISGTDRLAVRQGSGGTLLSRTVISEFTRIPAFFTIWGSTNDNSDVTTEKYTTAYPNSNPTQPASFIDVDCVYTARNVDYAPSWTQEFNQFSSTVAWTEGGETDCGLNIGCHLARIFTGIGNSIENAIFALANAIAQFFIPSDERLQARFDELKDNLDEELGFLLFPIAFFDDLLEVLTDSYGGCSTSSCTWDIGSFYGGSFEIDLSAPGAIHSSFWNFVRLTIQGVTVFLLILMLAHKLRETLSH